MTVELTNPRETQPVSTLTIRSQTPEEELAYFWDLLGDKDFFIQHGYEFILPDHLAFVDITKAYPANGSINHAELLQTFTKEVYDPHYYKAGIQNLETHRARIEQAFPTFQQWNTKWGFKMYPEYQVALTGYGAGGYYKPGEGRIVMLTREDGSFKKADPAETPIHEIVHLGIEELLVKKYGLTHNEKERLVDLLCKLFLHDLLPGYKYQQRGNPAIDPFVTVETIPNLPAAIEKYIEQYPRQKEVSV